VVEATQRHEAAVAVAVAVEVVVEVEQARQKHSITVLAAGAKEAQACQSSAAVDILPISLMAAPLHLLPFGHQVRLQGHRECR